MDHEQITIDVEASNRCNASCEFCPRDLTPHEGSMSPDVFEQTVRRVAELREEVAARLGYNVTMAFCGLGDALMNPRLIEMVRQTSAAGFPPNLTTNGARLTEERSRELLDAGLRELWVNCGEIGEEYDRVYRLSFDQLRENVVRFRDLAGDRCTVGIVLVDWHRDLKQVLRVRRYWEELGITEFLGSALLNRGGTLDVDGMAFRDYPEHVEAAAILARHSPTPVCGAPFIYPFIGYDGHYYLCSSDWEKRVSFGTVFDHSISEVMRAKLDHVEKRSGVCASCNHEPVNRVTAALRALPADDGATAGQIDRLVETVRSHTEDVHRIVSALDAPGAPGAAARARTLIPVRAD